MSENDTNKEIEEFFEDLEKEESKKNLKFLIDELEAIEFKFEGSETIQIKPVYSKNKKAATIDIKQKKKDNNNLF